MSNDIVLFEAKDGSLAMPVQVKAETVWLSQAQMAQLFGNTFCEQWASDRSK